MIMITSGYLDKNIYLHISNDTTVSKDPLEIHFICNLPGTYASLEFYKPNVTGYRWQYSRKIVFWRNDDGQIDFNDPDIDIGSIITQAGIKDLSGYPFRKLENLDGYHFRVNQTIWNLMSYPTQITIVCGATAIPLYSEERVVIPFMLNKDPVLEITNFEGFEWMSIPSALITIVVYLVILTITFLCSRLQLFQSYGASPYFILMIQICITLVGTFIYRLPLEYTNYSCLFSWCFQYVPIPMMFLIVIVDYFRLIIDRYIEKMKKTISENYDPENSEIEDNHVTRRYKLMQTISSNLKLQIPTVLIIMIMSTIYLAQYVIDGFVCKRITIYVYYYGFVVIIFVIGILTVFIDMIKVRNRRCLRIRKDFHHVRFELFLLVTFVAFMLMFSILISLITQMDIGIIVNTIIRVTIIFTHVIIPLTFTIILNSFEKYQFRGYWDGQIQLSQEIGQFIQEDTFRKYCRYDQLEEILYCLIFVKRYKFVYAPHQKLRYLKCLYDCYIKVDAPLHIPLTNEIRREIQSNISETSVVGDSVINNLESELCSKLKWTFQRFMKSKKYMNVKKSGIMVELKDTDSK